MKLLATLSLLALLAVLVNADSSSPPLKEEKKAASTTGHPAEGYYDYPDANGYYGEPPSGNSEDYVIGDVSEVPLEDYEGEHDSAYGYADEKKENATQAGGYPAKHEKVELKEEHPYPYHYPKHDPHPAPVYYPPKEEPKKEEPKKEEKKVPVEMDAATKLKIYKADPYNYYDHDWLKPHHPKYWVKVSDYEPPKVKDPLNKWEKENLLVRITFFLEKGRHLHDGCCFCDPMLSTANGHVHNNILKVQCRPSTVYYSDVSRAIYSSGLPKQLTEVEFASTVHHNGVNVQYTKVKFQVQSTSVKFQVQST